MFDKEKMNTHFRNYNHLGFFSPFYFRANNELIINPSFKTSLEQKNSKNIIDVPSVIENLLGRNILGDRTLIKDVFRTPWMAKPNDDLSDWNYFKVPDHKENILDQNEIALKFLDLIKNEILEYVEDKMNIGIMLTGGMDSRIIAGALDLLIKEGALKKKNIVALTWGNIKSRDAIYAQEIAKKMKWEWRHFSLTSDDLKDNIEISALRGSEYSPIHLHAMGKVRNEQGLDCILAGSYGDSIGRGEYASRKVTHIKDMREKIKNVNGFLKRSVINGFSTDIDNDIEFYWNKFPQKKSYQQLEQDYQLHYMRRKLNPCLSVVNENIPVYQVFTSPDVYGYIWSIHPKLRNNDIYKIVLGHFKTDLSNIPWARTGLTYGEVNGEPDSRPKNYHSYSEHINHELFDTIKNLVLSDNLEKLNIFNMGSLETYFKLMKNKLYLKGLKVEEKIIWLASLSRSVELFGIDKDITENDRDIIDYFHSLSPIKENILDQAKNIYLNLKRK